MNAIQRWYFYRDYDGTDTLMPAPATEPTQLWCKVEDVETLEILVAEATQKTIRARADRTIADDLVKSLRAEIIEKDFRAEQMEAALKICHQAILEVSHAQEVGANWYTRGASGLYSQIGMWVRKGLVAIKAVMPAL